MKLILIVSNSRDVLLSEKRCSMVVVVRKICNRPLSLNLPYSFRVVLAFKKNSCCNEPSLSTLMTVYRYISCIQNQIIYAKTLDRNAPCGLGGGVE